MEDKEKKLALQKAVGERVYHSRKLARMSKEELAERLGISSQYVNDIEQGKKCMSMAIFVELGEVFHTGLDELAHGAQKEEPVLEHLLCHLRQLLGGPERQMQHVNGHIPLHRRELALEIRVLVVEDDPETRMLTEALLSGRKGVCLCALAKDGLEGLELVEQTRPDIVLLDLILPGMDGLDFLRALRRRSARPAVVVASQASEPTVIRLAFQLGASYYLIKPLNFDSLPDLFHSLCLEPRERAAADYLRGMGASGLGVEAAARTAAVLSTGAEGAIPLKEGYAAAMAAQNTSYACVEKNIRSMVGKLQAGACGEYQALMGGLPAERPSNELFLRRLARRILEW